MNGTQLRCLSYNNEPAPFLKGFFIQAPSAQARARFVPEGAKLLWPINRYWQVKNVWD